LNLIKPTFTVWSRRECAAGVRAQSRQSVKIFLPSSEFGLTQPLTRRRVCPPPPVLGGGAHSLEREGLGESQFRRGGIHCGSLYIYVLCGLGHTEGGCNRVIQTEEEVEQRGVCSRVVKREKGMEQRGVYNREVKREKG
jgi:hypothetical protein